MNRRELRNRLAKADPVNVAGVRQLLRDARPALTARWLDAKLRRDLRDWAQRSDEALELSQPLPLEVAETWLLTVGGDGRGDVLRAVVRPSGPSIKPLAPRQVEAAIAGLAAVATGANRSVDTRWLAAALEVPGDPSVEVEGGSLGLAACVAVCSGASTTPPRPDVAGSAAIDQLGNLKRVEHLAAKCSALREQWPEVTTVVVAAEQDDLPTIDGMSFERAHSLRDALPIFGLEVGSLPARTISELKARLADIEHAEEQHHTVSRWSTLATQAREIGELLSKVNDKKCVDAQFLAGLLASHSGDNERAVAWLEAVRDEDCNIARRARKYVCLGSASIEAKPNEAVGFARRALEAARKIEDGEDSRKLLGRAMGTLGRAFLARGEWGEAERELRDGYEHHLNTDQAPEAARSGCYLACCLRMSGRAADALAVAERALELAAEHENYWDVARTTQAYALLERGRAHAALGEHDSAIADLQGVVDLNPHEEAYPSLGARRSLVPALRAAGRNDAARGVLSVCVRVARGSTGLTLRRVGAVAAAEELRAASSEGRGPLLPRSDLEAAWKHCFDSAAVNDVLRTWTY